MIGSEALLHLASAPGLLLLLLKAGLLVALAYCLIGQYQRSPAATRHRFWIALLVMLAALPVWTWLAPDIELPVLAQGEASTAAGPTLLAALLLVTYLAIAGLRALVLVFKFQAGGTG